MVGGWGGGARELVLAAAGEQAESVGGLALVGVEGGGEGRWRCWLAGRLSNAEELVGRFGPGRGGSIAAALARAHELEGPAAGDLLRGAFVLLTLDRDRGVATVARDHLGGRPLVYTRVGGGVLFAEHERDLLALLVRAPSPDRLAVQHWLERGGVPSGRTLFEGIHRLSPGHRLALMDGRVAIERYWRPDYTETLPYDREEAAERLRAEAFAAVARAAGAERVAVRLSGGLDSACVAAGLAARPSGSSRALALAAVFPGEIATDERDLIGATASHTGLELEQVSFEGPATLLDPARRHIERWRLPPSSPNLFVWEPIAALARSRDVEAMLDGEGGDELFGLAPYLIADALRRGRFRNAWSLAGAIPGVGADPDRRLRLRAIRVFGLGGLAPLWARRRRRRRAAARAGGSLLDRRARLQLAELDLEAAAGLEGPVWWRWLAAELCGGGEVFDIAGHLRRAAIDGGVDGRHPFLFDRELVEAVLATPPQLQFDPVRDRALLRDALKGRIPEQVRTRHSKSHFTPLVAAALGSHEGETLAAALGSPQAPVRAFLEAEPLALLVARRGVGMAGGPALQLWRVGVADAWLRSLERS